MTHISRFVHISRQGISRFNWYLGYNLKFPIHEVQSNFCFLFRYVLLGSFSDKSINFRFCLWRLFLRLPFSLPLSPLCWLQFRKLWVISLLHLITKVTMAQRHYHTILIKPSIRQVSPMPIYFEMLPRGCNRKQKYTKVRISLFSFNASIITIYANE